jgi:acetolactate synthase-1/3 small subunit
MAMRRGHHTSRVLKALGTPNGDSTPSTSTRADTLPSEFSDIHEDET